MAATRKMSRVAEIFLDASYVIALASKTDQHHARAIRNNSRPGEGAPPPIPRFRHGIQPRRGDSMKPGA